ncbi:uncharacterized protein LOC130675712 [Microplitis mediator]|uniref:uncharacterized protein LOC130675712 n=1 Tax=Microplitis mediator TaxID=375433 RepID=UPI002555C705|nr:uncharacterized protein LOC130675712 [Microplitis mediator]
MSPSTSTSLLLLFLNTFFIVSLANRAPDLTHRQPRFISFNSKEGNIDYSKYFKVDLDLSIPFLSIPLNHDEGADGPKPLVNVNLKSVAVAGVLAGVTAFVLPFFFAKPSVEHRYRKFYIIYILLSLLIITFYYFVIQTSTGRDDEFGLREAGQALNELMLGNNYVTPCLQYTVCSAIAKVSHARVLSSSDKIIDGIANLGWFKNVTDGTALQEAINVGRKQNPGCSFMFDGCKMPANVLESMMNQLGIK